jgi:hypothetical protein
MEAISPGRSTVFTYPHFAVDPARHDVVMMEYSFWTGNHIDDFLAAHPQYQFSHEYIVFNCPNHTHGHAVVWYPCGGAYYISDSNIDKVIKVNRPVEPGAIGKIVGYFSREYDDPALHISEYRDAVFVRSAALTAPDRRFDRAYPPRASNFAHRPDLLISALKHIDAGRTPRMRMNSSIPPVRRVMMADAIRHFREDFRGGAGNARAAAAAAVQRLEAAAALRAAATPRPLQRSRKQPYPSSQPKIDANLEAEARPPNNPRPPKRSRKQPYPSSQSKTALLQKKNGRM